jgi:serine phosphatase RsbU (regulator of sigma subunit)
VAEHRVLVAVAGRPHPAEVVSGDAAAVHWWDGGCRIAVIDGLGHGVEAALAARRAIAALDAGPDLAPADALRACHTALLGSRGAAISIARVDMDQRELVYAGIGNVEAHLWQRERREHPIAYRGIVGSVMRTVRPFKLPLGDDWTLILHSDGVSARIEAEVLGVGPPWEPESLAQAILARYARATDDAIVVVARPAPAPGVDRERPTT